MFVRNKEIVANQEMYSSLAIKEAYVDTQEYLEPDEDLHRAITFDELLVRTYRDIDEIFANK